MTPDPAMAGRATPAGSLATAEAGLRYAILALTLVLPCLLGLVTTYVLLPLAMVAVPLLLMRHADWRPDAAGRTFLVVFVALGLLFTVTLQTPADVLSVFNFIALPLYWPLSVLLRRGAAPGRAVTIARLALLGAAAGCLLAAIQVYMLDLVRAGVFNNDSIRLANTALLLGFLAPALGWHTSSGWQRGLLLLGPVLGLIAVLLAGTRIAMVAFPVLAVTVILLLTRHKPVALAVAALAAAAVVLIGLTNPFESERIASLVAAVGNVLTGETVVDEAVRIRLVLYAAGWEAFLASPLFGHGWSNMMTATGAYLSESDKVQSVLPHLHNEMLTFAVSGGLVGVALYVALIAAPIIAAWRSVRDTQYAARSAGVVTLAAAYVVMGATDTMVSFELHTALYVALVAVVLAYCRDATHLRPVENG